MLCMHACTIVAMHAGKFAVLAIRNLLALLELELELVLVLELLW